VRYFFLEKEKRRLKYIKIHQRQFCLVFSFFCAVSHSSTIKFSCSFLFFLFFLFFLSFFFFFSTFPEDTVGIPTHHDTAVCCRLLLLLLPLSSNDLLLLLVGLAVVPGNVIAWLALPCRYVLFMQTTQRLTRVRRLPAFSVSDWGLLNISFWSTVASQKL